MCAFLFAFGVGLYFAGNWMTQKPMRDDLRIALLMRGVDASRQCRAYQEASDELAGAAAERGGRAQLSASPTQTDDMKAAYLNWRLGRHQGEEYGAYSLKYKAYFLNVLRALSREVPGVDLRPQYELPRIISDVKVVDTNGLCHDLEAGGSSF